MLQCIQRNKESLTLKFTVENSLIEPRELRTVVDLLLHKFRPTYVSDIIFFT